jgi:hypothetical protein
VIGCIAIVALHVALLPFGVSNVLDSQGGQTYAANWVHNVRSSLAAVDQAQAPTTILPLTMPAAFVPGFEAPYELEQPFLNLLPEWHGSDRGQVVIIDSSGHLQPARAIGGVTLTGPEAAEHLGPAYSLSTHVNGSGDACFSSKTDGGQFRVVLPQTVTGEQLAVSLQLDSRHRLSLTPFVIGPPAVTVNYFPETVPAGSHRMMASLQSTPATIVGFSGVPANADFCVQGIQVAAVGVPSPSQPGQCQPVNIYGTAAGPLEPCVKWQ